MAASSLSSSAEIAREVPSPAATSVSQATAIGKGVGSDPTSENTNGHPDESPEELFLEARELFLKGHFEPSLERLQRVGGHPEFRRQNPGAVENLQGSIRHRQGDSVEAVSYFFRARLEDPRNLHYSLNLAEALRASGMIRLTEAALLDALELAPEEFLPNVRYRFFLIQTGRREQVIEEIRSVGEDDRNGLDVLAVVAALHASTGSYDKVDRVMQRFRANAGEELLTVVLSDPVFRDYREATARSGNRP